ncbi:uncharacterized protein LOC121393056 isoform X4 [Xenopus laevis]|uniref:Uncharacterized protein LOC121393056 isoform X4 n=1 Tax=Xenopus laevis TaxID=8355 RepID=A0A8J1MHX5_XENLA|nr:uncharacterized protein LOC121393056 isoform X4 [Xenopus laevis]
MHPMRTGRHLGNPPRAALSAEIHRMSNGTSCFMVVSESRISLQIRQLRVRSCCRRKAQERKAESHIQEQPRNSSSRRNVSKRLEQFYRKVEQESHRDLEMLKHLKEQNLQVLRLAMVRKGTREQMDQQLRQTLFFPVSRSAKHWLYYKIWIQCLFVSSQQVVPPRAAGLKAWDAEFQRRPEPLDDILQPQHFNLVNESGVPLCGFT